MDQDKPSSSTTTSSVSLDPVREKLKAWQASRGRLKENRLPWQPRFKRVINEIEPVSKNENFQQLLIKPPNKPSNTRELKTPSKRTVLSSQENTTQKDKIRRKLEIWKKIKSIKNATEDGETEEIKEKTVAKRSIPRPVVAPSRKSSVNFIELNKKLARQKIKADPVTRRITVADMHLKIRRSSLDKVRRHSNGRKSNYYCLKPEVSRKLSVCAKKVNESFESPKLDDEFLTKEQLKDVCVPATQDSPIHFQKMTASPEWKREMIYVPGNLASTPMTDSGTPKPITGNFISNFNVQFLLSPVKHISQNNLYSLTPVRRSARFSASRQKSNVFELDQIPANLMSNALYRENWALNLPKEDSDDDDSV
uniref:Uncharacterized protein n=1 Tax=Strigamia maritima TaxID=126957 RepID=T1IY31_STRMM